MSDFLSCSVCAENFDGAKRKQVTCAHCGFRTCRVCVAQYLKGSIEEPDCMSCNKTWGRAFLAQMMPKKYMAQDYKFHMERMIMDRERSILPATVKYLKSYQRTKTYENEQSLLTRDIHELSRQWKITQGEQRHKRAKRERTPTDDIEIRQLQFKCNEIRFTQQKLFRQVQRLRDRLYQEYAFIEGRRDTDPGDLENENQNENQNQNQNQNENNNEENEKEENDKYRTRGHCPATECNGFIGKGWECVSCAAKICPKCMAIVPTTPTSSSSTTPTDDHECKDEDLTSTALIRKQCKPCPNCRIRVFRVEGCAQMWCTQCNTAFDWNSGKVINTRYFHNPHYAEFVAAGGIARDPNDRSAACISHNLIIQRMKRNPHFPISRTWFLQLPSHTSNTIENEYMRHNRVNNLNMYRGFHPQHMELLGCLFLYQAFTRSNHIMEYDTRTTDFAPKYQMMRLQYLNNELNNDKFRIDMQRLFKKERKEREMAAVYEMYAVTIRATISNFLSDPSMPATTAVSQIFQLKEYADKSIRDIHSMNGTTPGINKTRLYHQHDGVFARLLRNTREIWDF